jgi:diacylglycerol kinase family enzyme
MRIGVLSNPTSHTNKAGMPAVRDLIRAHPGVLHREIETIGDVPPTLANWAKEDLELLVVNGGDGTVQAVMTEIVNHDPFGRQLPLAVAPGGKTNMLAMDLGARGKPVDVLKKILEIADAGGVATRIGERSLVGFRRSPNEPMIYGTFFGTAAIVRAVEYCRAHVYPLGLPNIVSHVVASAIIIGGSLTRHHGRDSSVRASEIAITLNDTQRLSGRYFVIIVSSFERLMMGARPFSHHGQGRLNFLSVENTPGTVFAAAVKALVTKPKEFSARGTISGKVRKVELLLDYPVMLDGEFFQPLPDVPIELTGDRTLPFVELDR